MTSDREPQASGPLMFRTPALPVQALSDWLAESDAEGLRERWSRPEIREAMYLASPSLHDAVERWMHDGGAPSDRILRSFTAYLARMSGRATPFGLFAGVTLGKVDTATELHLEPLSAARRRTRLDMGYLERMAAALATDHDLRREVSLLPNSSIYDVPGELRYAQTTLDGDVRSYDLATVEASPYLVEVVDAAHGGATFAHLIDVLCRFDVTREEAEAFLHDLIDSQVLVPDLGPLITGDDPASGFIEQLAGTRSGAPIAERLTRTTEALAAIDADGVGASTDRYRAIIASLGDLLVEPGSDPLFHTDLLREGTLRLGPKVIEELSRGVELLRRLLPRREEGPLDRFMRAFAERYEDREVRLVDALDEDLGVGFGTDAGGEGRPLLDGIAFPPEDRPARAFGPRDELLIQHILTSWSSGSNEVRLTSEDVEALSVDDPPPLPDAFEVLGVLAASSAADVDAGSFRVFIEGVDGPPGVRLLARFWDVDPDIRDVLVAEVRREEECRPDVTFAEIVHLPQDRLGNVLARPLLRDHELVYLGRSGAPQQLPVTDLTIRIQDGRLVLRSRTLDTEIVPRLTNAHYFSWEGNVALYRFLGLLQQHGTIGDFGWTWGALESSPFLPRVVHGRLVLSRAQWNIGAREVDELSRTTGRERMSAVLALRTARRIPRWVVFGDEDNELPVDLESPLSVDTLLTRATGNGLLALIERFPGPDELVVEGSDGRYTHQFVVPFVRPPVEPRPPQATRVSTIASAPRTFPPGSGWLFAKLYAGRATCDRVVVDLVAPLAAEAMADGAVDRWFFLRYGDPGWHVRFRLHGDPGELAGRWLGRLHDLAEPWVESGRISRIAVDTYEREVERYGGDEGILLAEEVFRLDSEAAVTSIRDVALDARWLTTLAGIDGMLAAAGLMIPERAAWAARRRDAFARELGTGADHRRSVGMRAREFRAQIEAELLAPSSAVGIDAFGPLFARIRDADLAVPIEELLESFTHMHVNRMLRDAHRHQEAVILDLLSRAYRSQLLRDE
jgi:thiopeptide-type bacteriocin biosynthesis protein